MYACLMDVRILIVVLGSVVIGKTEISATDSSKTDGFKFKTSISNHDYTLTINDVPFLTSADTWFVSSGQTYSQKDLLNVTVQNHKSDNLGKYKYTKYTYTVLPNNDTVEAWIKDYFPKPFVTFDLVYVSGLNGTRSINCTPIPYPPTRTFLACFNHTSAGFPSFKVQEASSTHKLGYLNLGGKMVGDYEKQLGIFNAQTPKMTDGMKSGPLAVFDENGNTILISPMINFLTTSMWHDGAPGGIINWGVMGGVDMIPAGYTVRTIAVYAQGINKAFEEYGSLMRSIYNVTANKKEELQKKDVTLNYLGYWTDNGAYYYYHTENVLNGKNVTYQSTLIDVQTYAESVNVSYGYLQLDSWWYYKGFQEAVKTWQARPEIFPDGIRFLSRKTGLPIAAHNRYWARDTSYAKQNNGSYNFVVEPIFSLPDDQTFWNTLLKNAKVWNLVLYEQDWFDIQTLYLASLQTDLYLGERWLTQMATAAEINNVTIQYCMSLPRNALYSLNLAPVTQARVSEDYHLDPEQWRIGISSILTSAIGLAPYKDTFWTTSNQPGNPRYPDVIEPFPELEAVVSSLSGGPVGPGDAINSTNPQLLMKCCNEHGLLLKPSKPATAIDKQIIKAAIPTSQGPEGEVWTTYTTITSDQDRSFGILFAANLSAPYNVYPNHTGFPYLLQDCLVFPSYDPHQWKQFNDANPLTISNCSRQGFCLYFFTSKEMGLNGTDITIFGELSKWVPMSVQRVTNIIHAENNMRVEVIGKPGERVTMTFLVHNAITQSTCTLNSAGQATFDVLQGCYPGQSSTAGPTITTSGHKTLSSSSSTISHSTTPVHSSGHVIINSTLTLIISIVLWFSSVKISG